MATFGAVAATDPKKNKNFVLKALSYLNNSILSRVGQREVSGPGDADSGDKGLQG